MVARLYRLSYTQTQPPQTMVNEHLPVGDAKHPNRSWCHSSKQSFILHTYIATIHAPIFLNPDCRWKCSTYHITVHKYGANRNVEWDWKEKCSAFRAWFFLSFVGLNSMFFTYILLFSGERTRANELLWRVKRRKKGMMHVWSDLRRKLLYRTHWVQHCNRPLSRMPKTLWWSS